jgi:preprotein translocase subunit SecF
MIVIKYRKIFFALSALMTLASFAAIYFYGLNLGIDFRGGTITEVRFETERPDKALIEEGVRSLEIGGFSLRPSGEDSYVIRTRELSNTEKEVLNGVFSASNPEFSIERSNTIGPVAGTELQRKAMVAVAVVVITIVLFIAFAFRKVSKPVSSWKYALATILSLAHDVVIPAGIFAVLGFFYGLEIDILFVTGLLAILGYSVNDTIVVFDRVRENLQINEEKKINEPFETTVGNSITQTLGRSINTSLTIFIVLLVLYIMGAGPIRDFVLLLLIGTVAGTYSSIFLASPLLVTLYKWSIK